MRFRLIVSVIFLLLVLSACSLAEDITPPPGYQSPTTGTPSTQATEPLQVTSTPMAETATPQFLPTSTPANTQLAPISEKPGASTGNFTGNLVNVSGDNIPEGQKVTLEGFDKDQLGNYQKKMEIETSISSNGSYEFMGVQTPQDRAFIIITSWEGIEYQSDVVVASPTTTDYSMPITVFEKTDDFSVLSMNQVHLIFELTSQDIIQVTELFVITNPGNQVIAITSDGTSIPFIRVPKNASNLQYQLSQGSAQLLNTTRGFAMLPGANKQYVFIATYNMPYGQNLKFEQLFPLPVSSLTIFLPQGMLLRGEQFTDAGLQDIQGQSYQRYQVNNIASGSTITMTLTGNLGFLNNITLGRQTIILIGIGLVGILLISLGFSLYIRDRTRFKKEEVQEGIEDDAIGKDRDNIVDALIALDDQFKAGEIPNVAYQKRRSELKERLREVV